MPLLFRQLGMSPFSLARPNVALTPLSAPKYRLFPFILHTTGCLEPGREHLARATDSLWPGRGWPGLGLPGQTPLDPSHHPHQTGTVGVTQHKSSAFTQPSVLVWCFRLVAAVATHRQHQHGTRGSGHSIGTRQTGTTRRTLEQKITKSLYMTHIWTVMTYVTDRHSFLSSMRHSYT